MGCSSSTQVALSARHNRFSQVVPEATHSLDESHGHKKKLSAASAKHKPCFTVDEQVENNLMLSEAPHTGSLSLSLTEQKELVSLANSTTGLQMDLRQHQLEESEPVSRHAESEVHKPFRGRSAHRGFRQPPFVMDESSIEPPKSSQSWKSMTFEPSVAGCSEGFPIAPCVPLHKLHLRNLHRTKVLINRNPAAFTLHIMKSRRMWDAAMDVETILQDKSMCTDRSFDIYLDDK